MRSETPTTDPLRRVAVALLTLGLMVAAAACGAHAADSANEPQFPPGPAFDHASHLDKGIECIDCHENAEDEDEAGMPEWDFCMECHEDVDEEREEGKKLADLFMGPDDEPRWHNVTKQGEDIIFSHAKHYDADVECTECHTDIEQSQRVSFDLRQDMDACMQCHTERETSNECQTCHVSIGPDWKPPSHSRLWMTLHGQEVRMGGAPDGIEDDCSLCHTQTMCSDCHRTRPPRDHKESWRRGGGHGIAASMDRARCQTCHEVHSCRACHENARPRSHRGNWGGRRSRHCLSACHEPLRPGAGDGCGVCHMGTPSHGEAPPKPGWHTADMDCLLCHSPLSHADNGQNCNSCHR